MNCIGSSRFSRGSPSKSIRPCAAAALLILLLVSSPCLAGSGVRAFQGTWSNEETLNGTLVQTTMTVESDGDYVMKTGSPPYLFFQSGRLIVKGDKVTFQVEDWSPKRDPSGRRIDKPPSGTTYYEFTSPDTLVTKSLNLVSVSTWYRQ